MCRGRIRCGCRRLRPCSGCGIDRRIWDVIGRLGRVGSDGCGCSRDCCRCRHLGKRLLLLLLWLLRQRLGWWWRRRWRRSPVIRRSGIYRGSLRIARRWWRRWPRTTRRCALLVRARRRRSLHLLGSRAIASAGGANQRNQCQGQPSTHVLHRAPVTPINCRDAAPHCAMTMTPTCLRYAGCGESHQSPLELSAQQPQAGEGLQGDCGH